jgi:hypothetical protein
MFDYSDPSNKKLPTQADSIVRGDQNQTMVQDRPDPDRPPDLSYLQVSPSVLRCVGQVEVFVVPKRNVVAKNATLTEIYELKDFVALAICKIPHRLHLD